MHNRHYRLADPFSFPSYRHSVRPLHRSDYFPSARLHVRAFLSRPTKSYVGTTAVCRFRCRVNNGRRWILVVSCRVRVLHVWHDCQSFRFEVKCVHLTPLESIIVPHQITWSWYTSRWWVGCYIWYSEEGTGQDPSPPRPLLAVPNVTGHPSTASVTITILRFPVPIKG